MEKEINKMFRNKRTIALDEVGIVPESPITYSDDDVNLSISIGAMKFSLPIISAAMDSVSSLAILSLLKKNGGIGLINLCGLISRYPLDSFAAVYKRLLENPKISTLQSLYGTKPIDYDILTDNLKSLSSVMNDMWRNVGVSATPQYAERLFSIVKQLGAKIMVLQSSFVSPFWKSSKRDGLNLLKLTEQLHSSGCIVIVGNVASLDVSIPLISSEVDAIILGIGPGQQCTTRKVLGIGSGHITTIADVREYIEKQRSNTRIIADGGIHNSGDIIKLFCTGAHAVILGGMFARTIDAPFVGFHYGMSSFHRVLPRGDLLTFRVNDDVTADRVLRGPSNRSDGTMAILPAITNALSNLGCLNIDDAYNKTSVVIFPSIATEGKMVKVEDANAQQKRA